ncbi:MAG: hypothetical protein ACRDQU_08105 [Pseudonocardiaceae bacterium]
MGRRLVYGIGILATCAYAFPYFALLNTKVPGLVLLGIVVSLLCHDLQYGPQAALIAEIFPTNVRYSGAGLGYQLASVIAGGQGRQHLVTALLVELDPHNAAPQWPARMPVRLGLPRRRAGCHGCARSVILVVLRGAGRTWGDEDVHGYACPVRQCVR